MVIIVDGEAYLSLDCTIIFELCFEGGISENRLVPVGGSLSELPVPQREGWVLVGWFKAPAETALDAGDGEAITPETVLKEGDTVYAHWRIPGDVNGDGEVDNRDVTRLLNAIRYPNVKAVRPNLDVNGDNQLTGDDAILLARFVKYLDVDLH